MRLDHFPHVLKCLFEDRDDLRAKSTREVTIEIHGSPPLPALLSAVDQWTSVPRQHILRILLGFGCSKLLTRTSQHSVKEQNLHPTCCLKERDDCARLTIVKAKGKSPFDLEAFLGTANGGRSITNYKKDATIVSQGDPCDGIFYIRHGSCKMSVVSPEGKEAV